MSGAGCPTSRPPSPRSTTSRRWCATGWWRWQRPRSPPDPELLALDRRRTLEPDWFQPPRMLGYACYADRFAGDLAGAAERIAYLEELGVTYLHLMPLLTPRPATTTAATRWRTTAACAPTSAPWRTSARSPPRCGGAGSAWCLDLVLNHVAREHEWARRARAGEAAYRAVLQRLPRPRAARRVRAHAARGLPRLRARQLHLGRRARRAGSGRRSTPTSGTSTGPTPSVRGVRLPIVLFLANAGVEVLRLDAIAFMWKRLGTDCQNQPEVHAITQALHASPGSPAPQRSSRPRRSSRRATGAYLGQGEHHGKVSELAYHNRLMVQVWSMLASPRRRPGRARPAHAAARAVDHTRGSPTSRCHDDIGWAIDDAERGRSGSPVRRTGPSCPTCTPASSPARPPAGWCSRTTRRPRPPDQRHRRLAWPASAGRPRPRGRNGCCCARHRPRLGRGPGALDGRRAGAAQRRRLGRRARSRGRQPLGAPAPDALAAALPAARPGPSRAGSSPACGTGPAGASSTTCTPRWPPRRSSPADPGVFRSCAGTRSDRCSGSTTSPTPPGTCRWRCCTRSA